MEKQKYSVIRFEPNASINILWLGAFACLLIGFFLIISDILDVGTLRSQNALKGGIFLNFLSLSIFIYWYQINIKLILDEQDLSIIRELGSFKKIEKFLYSEITSVEVGVLSRTITIKNKSGKSLKIGDYLSRVDGQIVDLKNDPEMPPAGRLRDLFNLMYEIRRRANSM